MSAKIYLEQWCYDGDKVRLQYKDDTVVLVKKSDFDRAFGCIVSSDKDTVIRDFAL